MTQMKSTSGSASAVRRSQRTPVASWSASRPSALTTGRVVAAASPRSGANRSSSDMPSSVTIAHSVATDGRARPVSICEIARGEMSRRRASSRSEIPRRSRSARSRRGTSSSTTLSGMRPVARSATGRGQDGPLYSASAQRARKGGPVAEGSVVIVGGTRGIGRELARTYADRGREVGLPGRAGAFARQVASEIGGTVRGLGLDLERPREIAERLADIGPVDHLALVAIDRDANTAREYDLERAIALVTLKLVGYTETIHALLPRMSETASILLFGGLAKDRPYPGSTTVSSINGGVTGMVHTLAVELGPIRVNAIHPGIVGDSPMWRDTQAMLDNVTKRTPIGRPVTMDEIVHASLFLLENGGVSGVNLAVDGGWLLL